MSYEPYEGIEQGESLDTAKGRQPYVISDNGYGLLECQLKVRTNQSESPPALESAHPTDARLKCWKVDVNKIRGGLVEMTIYYVGIKEGDMTVPEIQISMSSTQEPIETHPRFEEYIGGKPSAPLNSCVFIDPATNQRTVDDKVGVFSEFPIYKEDGTKNPFAGIKSFFYPTATIKGTVYTSAIETVNSIAGGMGGRTTTGDIKGIDTAPSWMTSVLGQLKGDGLDESYATGRNYLVAGFNVEKYGAVYKVSYELTASGPRGWNTDIYPDATT